MHSLSIAPLLGVKDERSVRGQRERQQINPVRMPAAPRVAQLAREAATLVLRTEEEASVAAICRELVSVKIVVYCFDRGLSCRRKLAKEGSEAHPDSLGSNDD